MMTKAQAPQDESETTYRFVDSYFNVTVPHDPIAVLENVITPQTHYLVFDLDRTIHKECNMGELLGWEIIASRCYGEPLLQSVEAHRKPGRFIFIWSHPLRMLYYLYTGGKLWLYPGLFYLFLGKILAKFRIFRNLLIRYFGPDPIASIQDVTRLALMHHMAGLSQSELTEMAQRVWLRYQHAQVFTHDHIQSLKHKYPQLTIIISSASPRPMLNVAKQFLGVDAVISSEIHTDAEVSPMPFDVDWRYLSVDLSRDIAPPSRVRMNRAHAKIEQLIAKYPDFSDPKVEKVGVTDNKAGEDSTWVEHFTQVVQVNTGDRFSPLVPSHAPIKLIHTYRVCTAGECARCPHKDHPNRSCRLVAQNARFIPMDYLETAYLSKAETLTVSFAAKTQIMAASMAEHDHELNHLEARLEQAIAIYNDTPLAQRRHALRKVRAQLKRWKLKRAEINRLGYRCNKIQWKLQTLNHRADKHFMIALARKAALISTAQPG